MTIRTVLRVLPRDFLTGERYEVATFATGAEARDAVPTFQPDVILVEMVMPGLSGRDVLDALRRDTVTVPVILVPGTPRRVGEGFFRVLVNPFNFTNARRGRGGCPEPSAQL